MARLPHFSIATKLYAVFALLATVTVALAIVAVLNARRHAALTGEFESAFAGALNVERVKALFDAIEMDSRGMTMSPDAAGATQRAVPYRERGDEVGALARSIAVFQDAMRKNEELGRTIIDDAQSRASRQERMSAEISGLAPLIDAITPNRPEGAICASVWSSWKLPS